MSWTAEKCRHGKMGPAGGCEECFNEHMNLTAVAHTQQGLEYAAKIIEDGAIDAFKSGADGYAKGLRELRDHIMSEAKRHSEQHDVVLKEMELPVVTS